MVKKTGNLVSLSEQQLLDCMLSFWEMNCWWGSVREAFEYIITNNGIDTEKSYPYEGKVRSTCRTKGDLLCCYLLDQLSSFRIWCNMQYEEIGYVLSALSTVWGLQV